MNSPKTEINHVPGGKLVLIHGDNIPSSRNELEKFRQQGEGRDVRLVDGRKISEADLVQAIQSRSLFGGDRTVIIEEFLSRYPRKNKEIETIVERLGESSQTAEIVLWEKKTVVPSLLTLFESAHAKIILCKTSPLIFRFLDELIPGKQELLLPILVKLTESEFPELVFAMLVKRIRTLIMMKGSSLPKGLAPWQLSRLTTQARAFTMDELLSLHRRLTDFEFAWKSGRTPQTVNGFLTELVVCLKR